MSHAGLVLVEAARTLAAENPEGLVDSAEFTVLVGPGLRRSALVAEVPVARRSERPSPAVPRPAGQQGRTPKTGVHDAVPEPLATCDQRSLPSEL